MSNITEKPLLASTDLAEYHPATAQSSPRVMVIAEVGVNHDGQVSRAVELIQAAATAGTDAVKFQLFSPERLLSNQARLADYQKGQADDSYTLLKNLALSLGDFVQIRKVARECKVLFIVTPFSLEDIDDLATLDVDAVKIASPDAVNIPLIEKAAGLGKPLFISTGTAELDELKPAADILNSHKQGGALLQCVSSYPTPADQAALSGIGVLARQFNMPVGYSDHTASLQTGQLAVAAGACVIEKHLTYDCNAPGPDHAASITPDMLTQYVKFIREAEAALGPAVKSPLPIEADVCDVSRQSLCVTRDLPAGHALTDGDLTIKRPGGGKWIAASRLYQAIGRTLAKNVKRNDLLSENDLLPESDLK